MASIFIQLASYHDYELPRTIQSAISQSSGENELFFGVHHNFYENNDIFLPELRNLKVTVSAAPDNLGMGLSRNLAHQFYSGEDYYLQVDSHTHFRKDWDKAYISDVLYYQSQGFEKPLLTSYPKNYWYEEGEHKEDKGWGITCISFEEDLARFKEIRVPSQTAWSNPYGNIFSRSVSGGSIFTVGPFIVPNTNTHSIGEEILIAARAFTNGYDLLLPREGQIAHLYYDAENPSVNNRRLVPKDFYSENQALETKGLEEVQRIFLTEEVGNHALGTQRTLREFEVFAGLDFANGLVLSSANMKDFPTNSPILGLSCPVGDLGNPLDNPDFLTNIRETSY